MYQTNKMKDSQKITLKVAGKGYDLTLSRDEKHSLTEKEEVFRLAEREVNRLYTAFEKAQYVGYTSRDHLALTALQLATSRVEQQQQGELGNEDMRQLNAICEELEQYLNKI